MNLNGLVKDLIFNFDGVTDKVFIVNLFHGSVD